MNLQISVSKFALAAVCQEYGIKRLAVFGSALRENFEPESDIDVLVEFEPGRTPGLLGIAEVAARLSALFGREVDLVTRSAVEQSRNYIRRRAILDSAEEVYAT
ncbi:MAG: nucleotidyltransferase family protein [Gemmatimonadota bacterium]|nr:nucleotidyltransferase family protein [Gemmatimonadota bacterium]